MDICEDWGEGSGLEIWDADCNTNSPGINNNVFSTFK